ncbi:MAG: hypothetical protein IT267_04215 [Saprospiraceae bacterium]|nr:hypothetical protein [Saprospiraceae bacterium]
MKDTKFYQFMKTLSPVEMNRLSKFLESPYFNKNEKLLKIYYAVESNIRVEKSIELNKQNVWNQIYLNSNYDDDKFRKHCAQLMDLVEDWLAQEIFEKNKLRKANYLLESVYQRQLDNLYSSSTSRAMQLVNNEIERPANFYLNVYEIESLLYKLEKIEAKRIDKKNIGKINLENLVTNLDYFYIAEKLKYYCTLLSWTKISNINDKSLFIEDIIKIAEQSEFAFIPSIAIYLKIYYTYKESENENHYFELKSLIDKYIYLFPKEEAKGIMEAAINYTIRKSHGYDNRFLHELFELYKSALTNETLLINNELSQWTFKNIVSNALLIKEFEWAEEFITLYEPYLNPKVRVNAVIFNRANLYFNNKEYKNVLYMLNKVQYEELFYNLNSKAMVISSYYELGEFNVLNSILESFKIFLNRNKDLSKEQKIRYLNLINFTHKLVSSVNKPKSELLKLKRDIQNTLSIGKLWLIEKIDELLALVRTNESKSKKNKKIKKNK